LFDHRLIRATQVTVASIDPPFSSFAHIDSLYEDNNPAIRRLFSLARAQDAHTLVIEEIQPAGIIIDENDEITQYCNDFQMTGLKRISFWKSVFTVADVADTNTLQEKECLGYVILKRDQSLVKKYHKWHVFEAVFKKYDHKHNCVPNPAKYEVTVGNKRLSITGLLFAQQNGLNKCCSQVALRSVISRISNTDVSYREINGFAQAASSSGFDPAKGLTTTQIRSILNGFKIPFRDFDYEQGLKGDRQRYPYGKYLYSGIESGNGALLGFRLSGPAIRNDVCHIIPFYGHTFNKDTWAPEADRSYFKVGEKLGYIPSENWTSSFLGHDDNFGPNFCVPRLYISPKQVEYVVELLKSGIKFGGSQAEVLSLQFLYPVLKVIDQTKNVWLQRLKFYADRDVQRIVLRAIAVNRDTYIRHLINERDWEQHAESDKIINVLSRTLPKNLWVVEVSIPELFPANERKLGDIVLNGGIKINSDKKDRSNFMFVRLPSIYLFDLAPAQKKPNFRSYPSALVSHFPLLRLD